MAESVKGGYQNSPCNHCDRKLTAACQMYSQCAAYRDWINASWADFRRFYQNYGEVANENLSGREDYRGS